MTSTGRTADWIIHVGAPRTGTSYLRRHVFPYLPGVRFTSKQDSSQEQAVNQYFADIAHSADGDELSVGRILKLQESLPRRGRYLVSEEHFLWSIYHMLGNTTSRAALLHEIAPQARIIITIRRQPEWLISLYKYVSALPNHHLQQQLKRIENMVDLDIDIRSISINRVGKIPVGASLESSIRVRDPGQYYFKRDLRPFVSAEVSWYRLLKIYGDLFGRENVLLLPLEMLAADQSQWFRLLGEFLGEDANPTEPLPPTPINASAGRELFRSSQRQQQFLEAVLAVNRTDNEALLNERPDLRLDMFGYLENIPPTPNTSRHVGLQRGENHQLSERSLRRASYAATVLRRGGVRGVARETPAATSALYHRFRAGARSRASTGYRDVLGGYQALRGLDLQRMESLDALGLAGQQASQYEGTKRFELTRLLRKIDLPRGSVVVDFGSGKGSAVACLASDPRVDHVYGIELSDALAEVSRRNLRRLGIANATILNVDARETPEAVLDEAQVAYLYNPFPAAILTTVVESLRLSLMRVPREFVLIYLNPLHADHFQSLRPASVQRFTNPLSNADFLVFQFPAAPKPLPSDEEWN